MATLEEIESLIIHLQMGYSLNRKVQGNERLSFLMFMVVITKQSVPQTVKITRNQFRREIRDGVFEGIKPRSKKSYRIHLPLSFMDYLNSYCNRFLISSDGLLFPFNPEYVNRRVRELCGFLGYDITIGNIQTVITYSYRSGRYQQIVWRLSGLLGEVPNPERYYCFTADLICKMISEYAAQFSWKT